jgi:ABC-type dipeptide/oligopeptide/nickel transport system permease subunit
MDLPQLLFLLLLVFIIVRVGYLVLNLVLRFAGWVLYFTLRGATLAVRRVRGYR